MKGEQMQEKEIQNGFKGEYRVNFFFFFWEKYIGLTNSSIIENNKEIQKN